MEYVEVDGSRGEGGGQILRTAVAFSAIVGKPVRVSKVRAGREVPGLKRQHASSLRVLSEVFDCTLGGAVEGSSEVTFAPGPLRSREVSIDMGTAASIPLVLQAVIPAVSLSNSSLRLRLRGGTDVPWSPTFDYLTRVVQPVFGAAGVRFDARATRRGYYPKGGGKVEASIEPCPMPNPLRLDSPATLAEVTLSSRCGALPRHVAERQARAAKEVLVETGLNVREEVTLEESDSPGSSITISATSNSAFLGSDALGSRGRRAEEVGLDSASRFVAYLKSGACLDDNVADMLIPLLSLADGPSAVRLASVTPHLESGIELARLFTSCEFLTRNDGGGTVLEARPSGR
ncbi:MAG: RNA 3'-terminal phosphate cyclase [archaeon]|nr:MAG: RNA 3'-terminal phosphate cyclase [archaeon]